MGRFSKEEIARREVNCHNVWYLLILTEQRLRSASQEKPWGEPWKTGMRQREAMSNGEKNHEVAWVNAEGALLERVRGSVVGGQDSTTRKHNLMRPQIKVKTNKQRSMEVRGYTYPVNWPFWRWFPFSASRSSYKAVKTFPSTILPLLFSLHYFLPIIRIRLPDFLRGITCFLLSAPCGLSQPIMYCHYHWQTQSSELTSEWVLPFTPLGELSPEISIGTGFSP